MYETISNWLWGKKARRQSRLAPHHHRRLALAQPERLEDRRVMAGEVPEITVATAAATYVENSRPVLLNPAASVNDADSAHFASGSLVVVNPNGASTDRLRISGQGGGSGQIGLLGNQVKFGGTVIGTYHGGDGNAPLKVSLNANTTPEAVAALLQRITFFAGGNNPLAGRRTLRYSLNDGTGNTGTATGHVNVVAVGDPPVLTFAAAAEYIENGPSLTLDPAALLTDVDSPSYRDGSLVVNIASGATASDRLMIRNQGTAAGMIGVASGKITHGGQVIGDYLAGGSVVITFTSTTVTPAIVEKVLRSLVFYNVSENPSTVDRALSITVRDSEGGSATATLTLSVEPVNDPLTFKLPPLRHYVERTGPLQIATGAALADVDLPDFDRGKIVVRNGDRASAEDWLRIRHQGTGPGQIGVAGDQLLIGGAVFGTFSGGNADNPLRIVLSRSVSLDQLRRVLASLVFDSDAAFTPADQFGAYAVNRRHLKVQLLDDGGAAFSSEVVVQMHPDAPEVKYLPKADSPRALFEDNGLMSLMPLAEVVNFSRPSFGGGELTLSITSGAGSTDHLVVRQVLQGKEVLTVEQGNVKYNGGFFFATIEADSNDTFLHLRFNDSATPAAVQILVRNLCFGAYGHEPTPGPRTFAFALSDSTHSAAIPGLPVVNVIPVNDAPHISSGLSYGVARGDSVQAFGSAKLSDSDNVDLNGGSLRVAIRDGSSDDRLRLSGAFTLAGTSIMYNGQAIGTANEQGGEGATALVISFNESVSYSVVQSLIRSLRFSTSATASLGTRRIALTVTDVLSATSKPSVASVTVTA